MATFLFCQSLTIEWFSMFCKHFIVRQIDENYSFFESSGQNVYLTYHTHSPSLPPQNTILLKPMSVVSHFQDITPFLPDYREREGNDCFQKPQWNTDLNKLALAISSLFLWKCYCFERACGVNDNHCSSGLAMLSSLTVTVQFPLYLQSLVESLDPCLHLELWTLGLGLGGGITGKVGCGYVRSFWNKVVSS